MGEIADELQLIGRILRNPARYLPERSLPALGTFLSGYEMACYHVCRPFRQAVEPTHFGHWLIQHISYNPKGSVGPFQVVESMFNDPLEAFEYYLRLLDEYLTDSPEAPPMSRVPSEFSGTTALMSTIQHLQTRMPMYLGAKSLMRLYSYLQGYELAHRDIRLDSDDLSQYRDVGKWIKARLGEPQSSWYRAVVRLHPDD